MLLRFPRVMLPQVPWGSLKHHENRLPRMAARVVDWKLISNPLHCPRISCKIVPRMLSWLKLIAGHIKRQQLKQQGGWSWQVRGCKRWWKRAWTRARSATCSYGTTPPGKAQCRPEMHPQEQGRGQGNAARQNVSAKEGAHRTDQRSHATTHHKTD